jgi:hypothetical protein
VPAVQVLGNDERQGVAVRLPRFAAGVAFRQQTGLEAAAAAEDFALVHLDPFQLRVDDRSAGSPMVDTPDGPKNV